MLEDTNTNNNNSSLGSSSHCWEEDGSFHSVCIFVLSVSGFCSLAAIFTVYRIVRLIIEAVREPNDIKESLRKYKLQPVNNNGSGVELEMRNLERREENVNSIQLVEVETVTVSQDNEEETRQSREWLC